MCVLKLFKDGVVIKTLNVIIEEACKLYSDWTNNGSGYSCVLCQEEL